MSENYQFEGQRPGEEIEVIIRTHPMRFLWPGVKVVLLLIVPTAIYLFFGVGLYQSILMMVFLVLAISIAVGEWYEYSNDICLITNFRILSIIQIGYFKRQVAEAELDKLQEAKYTTRGMLQTMFNFGNIELQTASSISNIVLKNVPRPYEVQQEITKRIKQGE